MDLNERETRELFCEVGERIHEKGFVAATDGSLSARLGQGRLMFSPAECSLGQLRPEMMLITDHEGKPERPQGGVTGEYRLHLMCYRRRSDIGAVIHAHPLYSTALTVAGLSLTRHILPEVVLELGSVPTAPYATPFSEEGADTIGEPIKVHDAVIIDRRGTITVDETLEGAYFKLEKLEYAAHIMLLTKQLGIPKVLPQREVEKLRELGKDHGLNPEAVLPDPSWDLNDFARAEGRKGGADRKKT